MDNQTESWKGKPLAEMAAEQIKSYIIENNLEPGDKLPNEFQLAETIGVGRGTIREAVKILESRNLIEIRRGAGTFVSDSAGVWEDPLGFAFVKDKGELAMDLVSVRLMLEPQIARMAAVQATEKQVKQLKAQCEKIEQLISRGISYIEDDILFHKLIAACTGNRVVEKLIPVIHSSIGVFSHVTKGALKEETIQTHREITEAISKGDGDGAFYAMTMHLIYNQRIIKDVWEKGKSNN